MIRLIPFEDKANEVLSNILSSKTASIKTNGKIKKIKDVINSDINKILKRYIEYNNNKKRLQYVSKSIISNDLKKSMLHCYNIKTSSLSKLKKNILNNQPINLGKTCQMCGINSADTFDHYIPKEEMAEFSVYPHNLIPVCSECNRKKSNSWTFDRNFINLYYDIIPSIQILRCKIVINEVPIPNYYFKKDWEKELGGKINKYNIRLIKNHYISLDLLERYNMASVSKLVEMIYEYNLFIKNIEGYKNHLKAKYINFKEQYGINHFSTILIDGLLRSNDFFEYLQKKNK